MDISIPSLIDLAKLFSEVGEEESFAHRLPTCASCETTQQATCIDGQLHLMPLSILAGPVLTLEVKKLPPLWTCMRCCLGVTQPSLEDTVLPQGNTAKPGRRCAKDG